MVFGKSQNGIAVQIGIGCIDPYQWFIIRSVFRRTIIIEYQNTGGVSTDPQTAKIIKNQR